MEQYHTLLKEILSRGNVQFDPRTKEYTLGISAWLNVYDVRKGFPLVTTKNVPPRLPFEELFWKLRGERNVKSLVDRNINIWTANAFDFYLKKNNLDDKFPKHSSEWNNELERYQERIAKDAEFAKEAGDLGLVYGYQWRHWKKPVFMAGHAAGTEWIEEGWKVEEVDQLVNLIENIKKKPGSRYHVLNAWNPGEIKDMALGPCPFWHQFTVYGGNLDLTMVQRSCDTYLGVPFNIAQDSLLLKMVAKETGYKPRFFNHQTINTHFYLGVPPRSDFLMNVIDLEDFQKKVKKASRKEDYMEIRDWYLKVAPKEREGNERKDHIPFVLEQLSKQPMVLPDVELAEDVSLFDAIKGDALDYVNVHYYRFHKWDSKAAMAA